MHISSSDLSFLPDYECIQRRTPRLLFQIRKELPRQTVSQVVKISQNAAVVEKSLTEMEGA